MSKKKELDNVTSPAERLKASEQEQEERPEDLQKEPKPEDYRPEEMSTDDLLRKMITGMDDLNNNVKIMNKNLFDGYRQTEKALITTLTPLSEAMAAAKKQQEQVQQQMGGGGQQQFQMPAGAFGQQSGHFDPFTANRGGGQNPMQQMAMQGGQGNPMMFYLLDKMFTPDPSQNLYSMLGQRVFAESIMSNMLMNRAAMKKLREKNLLDEDEYNTFTKAQDQMYNPLMGTKQLGGQDGQTNKDNKAE